MIWNVTTTTSIYCESEYIHFLGMRWSHKRDAIRLTPYLHATTNHNTGTTLLWHVHIAYTHVCSYRAAMSVKLLGNTILATTKVAFIVFVRSSSFGTWPFTSQLAYLKYDFLL